MRGIYAKVGLNFVLRIFIMKKCWLLFLVLFISACGFEPLYVQKKQESLWYFGGEFDTSISAEMAKIKVQTIAERFGQELRNDLLDMLTPLGAPKNPTYRLFVDVAPIEITQQAMRDDITATRERVRYKVNYRLLSAESSEVLVIIVCLVPNLLKFWSPEIVLPMLVMIFWLILIRQPLPRKKHKPMLQKLLPMI